MNNKNSKKKLKMERLSPIRALNQSHFSCDALRTPARSHRRQKDAYAIETTCSPEFDNLPTATGTSLQKPRKCRSIVRGRTSKKPNSTPLSGLISRKTVPAAPEENLRFSDPYGSNSSGIPSPCRESSVGAPSDPPQIDEYSPKKPPHSPRHSEIVSLSAIFPPKPQPAASGSTPLAGIVNKRSSHLNRSLNDSITVLREAEDPSDDEEIPSVPCSVLPKSEKVSIESFESPRKPNFRTSASIFKTFHSHPCKKLTERDKAPPLIEKSSSNNVEMCGNERKNRKRALDFNSTTFMVSSSVNDIRDGYRSPVFSLVPPCCDRENVRQSPVLVLPLNHDCEFDSQTPDRHLISPRDELGEGPVLRGMSPCRDGEEGSQSPVLSFTPSGLTLEEGRRSSFLDILPPTRGPKVDFRSPVLNTMRHSGASHENERDCKSPILEFKSVCREREEDWKSPVLGVASTSRDHEQGSVSPVLSFMPACGKLDEGLQSPVVDILPPNRDLMLDVQSTVLNTMRHAGASQEGKGGCKSPILEFKSVWQEREEGRKSPVLGVASTSRDHGQGSQSPVFNLIPSLLMREEGLQLSIVDLLPANSVYRKRKEDSKSPILIPSCRDHEQGSQSPILNLSSSSLLKHADFVLKPAEVREVPSPTEQQDAECPSDTDSIIESTPRRSQNKNYGSCGFTASSGVKIETDSPPRTSTRISCIADQHEIPEIEEVVEESFYSKMNEKRDLVVCHDTSSDDSTNGHVEEDIQKNSCDVIFPSVRRESPNMESNYEKRPIQSFESPIKVAKAFSEAVHIGAFGSPDSNASHRDEVEEEDGTDEVIELSTTQEYVEESEQVRPTKRRKKGSLLERVRGVIAKVDASNALFDYELKCGLRPDKGKFVSAPLVVLKKPNETTSLFLLCKPYKYFKNSSVVKDDLSSFVLVHVNKLPCGVSDGSVVLLHFPLNVMYSSELHIPCVMAGHQIVPHPTEPKVDVSPVDHYPLESINSFSSPYSPTIASFRSFSSILTRTLSEAALCQNLIEDSNLYLTVLHVTKLYEGEKSKKMSVLCCDEEFSFCWVEFSSVRDVKRAVALETLNVLADGSQLQTKGFSLVDRVSLDRKTKHLISYCTSDVVDNEIIFIVSPKEANWVISSTDGLSQPKKIASKLGDVLSEKILGCRYLIEVHGIEKEPGTAVKDSEGQSVRLTVGENSCVSLDHPVPFLLDAVYFCDGQLFSDEHTRVVPKF